MRVLVIGGSVFLGRAVAEAALRAHHEVFVLNRGLSQPDVPGALAIVGDRNEAKTLTRARAKGPFDLVVDTSGFEPETVALSAEMLGDACDHYMFISTVSAFADWPAQPVSERSPLLPFSEDKRSYGSSKLPWWLARFAQGGKVIHPELDVPISPIDARDVADFVLTLAAEPPVGGEYVVSGVSGESTLGDLLRICATVTGSSASPVHIADDVLLAHEVEPWSELPLWAPRGVGLDGIWSSDCSAALRAGLHLRPLSGTVADTWSWMQSVGAAKDVDRLPALRTGIGLAADKEAQLCAALPQ